MHFESEGGVVPMLCPGCCTLDDIPDWDDWDAGPDIGNWTGLGKAIIDGIAGKKEYPDLPPFRPAPARTADGDAPADRR